MCDVEIRKAGADDVPIIHDLAQIAFRHTYRDILSPEQMEYMMDWMYAPENIMKQFEDGHVYYILSCSGLPCGYVSVQEEGSDSQGVEVYHLQKIYVLPSCQGKGLGRILFNRALEHVRTESHGAKARVELNVNRSNKAVSFYRHLGMTVLRQGDFHIGNGFYMNDYIMGLDL